MTDKNKKWEEAFKSICKICKEFDNADAPGIAQPTSFENTLFNLVHSSYLGLHWDIDSTKSLWAMRAHTTDRKMIDTVKLVSRWLGVKQKLVKHGRSGIKYYMLTSPDSNTLMVTTEDIIQIVKYLDDSVFKDILTVLATKTQAEIEAGSLLGDEVLGGICSRRTESYNKRVAVANHVMRTLTSLDIDDLSVDYSGMAYTLSNMLLVDESDFVYD